MTLVSVSDPVILLFFPILQSLDLVRFWLRGSWFLLSSSSSSTSLSPPCRRASSREGLNGTSPFKLIIGPWRKTTQAEETTKTIREKSTEYPAALFTMATNREHQLRHMTGFPRTMYPFPFNSMRSHSPFDLLASSHLFGRFGADLPKEMAALCE